MASKSHPQEIALKHSLEDPASFWDAHAKELHWATPYTAPLRTSNSNSSSWEWFPDAKISTTYNLITRHILAGNGDIAAIIWDSPVTGKKLKISYRQLQEDVEHFAEVLRERSVVHGDRVLIYMPMVPEALVAMLATVHLGAVHSVVFGGFAPAECAKRIESAEPKLIITASCGIEGGNGKRRVISYPPLVREAISKSKWKPQNTIVFQREELFEPLEKSAGELNWDQLVRSVRTRRGLRGVPKQDKENVGEYQANGEEIKAPSTVICERDVEIGESFPSTDAQYIIYTSGTTGTPKGVVRSIGGHLVGLNWSMKHLFGIKGPGDVLFTASDIGWVVGHSYIVYAPLLVGATTVLFEGKPVGTPDAGTFWRIIEEYKVNVLFTAPTALRAIHLEDPHNTYFTSRNLESLRGLFLAGERSEPSIVQGFQDLLTTHCAPGAKVVDNWWSSESGSPISGICLGFDGVESLPIKPGSAGKSMPGWGLKVVDDDGKEVENGKMGNIVLRTPLAPTGFRTLWRDEERFWKGYLKRFGGRWVDTGDAGIVDKHGYVHVMSRTDDILNVAAHRISTGTLEQALLIHPSLSEAYIVPAPDPLKGQIPFAFVVLSSDAKEKSPQQLFNELNTIVRKEVGPIASLGGVIEGKGIVPKTRSGKTLRRVLKELLEKEGEGKVDFPATIEDPAAVERARVAVKQWVEEKRKAKARL